MNIEEAIAEFAEREREEAEAAKEKERNQMCLDLESYMAKEIKYQTALLHRLLEEIHSTIRRTNSEYNIPKEGYRRNEQPTGEEVNSIVKFWYGVTAEQYKHINSMLKDERKKNRKAAAALAATSTAALGLLIKLVCFSDNQ